MAKFKCTDNPHYYQIFLEVIAVLNMPTILQTENYERKIVFEANILQVNVLQTTHSQARNNNIKNKQPSRREQIKKSII